MQTKPDPTTREEIPNPLGISPLPIEPSAPAANVGFQVLDFFGIYLFQQFFTMLAFSLISAFVVPPSIPDLVGRWFGESGAQGTLGIDGNALRQTMMLGATLLGNAMVILLYLFRGRWIYRISWSQMGWRASSWKELLRWSLLFYPLVFSFTMSYNVILKLLSLAPPRQQIASFLSAHQPDLLRIFALLLVLFAAPLTEELLYRGILFPALRKYMDVHPAALISGLIFGVAHVEPMTILPLSFLGYLLALSFHHSRSIWIPILLHACNNLLAFLFLLYTSHGT